MSFPVRRVAVQREIPALGEAVKREFAADAVPVGSNLVCTLFRVISVRRASGRLRRGNDD